MRIIGDYVNHDEESEVVMELRQLGQVGVGGLASQPKIKIIQVHKL